MVIILIHKGYSWYLPYTLAMVRRSNPKARILLVTDQKNTFLRCFAEIIPISEHWEEAEKFSKVYRHLSPNDYAFELLCFQRWFVLKSVFIKQGISQCFYLDSDVLVYSNLSQIHDVYKSVDVTVHGKQVASNIYINKGDVLDAFCGYIFRMFEYCADNLQREYEKWNAAGLTGGISDMHAFKEFINECMIKTVDTADIIQGAVFDTVFSQSNGFEMRDGYKLITWKDSKPYGRHITTGETVRFHTLHMQGNSKRLILSYHRLSWLKSLAIGALNHYMLK